MKTTVMITTRNRCADLRRTLEVLRTMDPLPFEILVTADGCTDDTVAMVRTEHPHCSLHVNQAGAGSVASRNRMVREAQGELVVSLDDDSYPQDRDFFARVESLFADHPEAGVITFPELCDSGFLHQHDPLYSQGHYVPSYPNCAAVMKRDVYLRLGGFPPFFFHNYEEPDYAAQCAGLGLAVWFEPSVVVRHHYSPANRDWLRLHQKNARNELWSVWMRCPWPWLPLVSAFRIFRQLAYAKSQGWRWVLKEPQWWWWALKGLPDCMENRSPVAWARYFAWMKLARVPLFTRQEWNREFNA